MINDRYMDLLKDENKISYNLYKEGKPLQSFNSHQPLLIHLLNTIKEGNVLEFGTGVNSTLLMSIICGMQNRKLLSIETSRKWHRFGSYQGENHEVLFIDKNVLSQWSHPLFKRKYSIAFIDGSPAELRQPFIELLKDSADYLIVHDSECVVQGVVNCYGYNFSMFKHIYHFKSVPPMTTLLSNMDEINKDILTVFEGM
jgi:hypothetical protein